jgi:hypothetical protein
LIEKDMSIKYFKRACRVIRNSVLNIKPKWDGLVSQMKPGWDVNPPKEYVLLQEAIAHEIYYLTNVIKATEEMAMRNKDFSITSEGVGEHTVSQSLGANILQLSPLKYMEDLVWTVCFESIEIFIELGWYSCKSSNY